MRTYRLAQDKRREFNPRLMPTPFCSIKIVIFFKRQSLTEDGVITKPPRAWWGCPDQQLPFLCSMSQKEEAAVLYPYFQVSRWRRKGKREGGCGEMARVNDWPWGGHVLPPHLVYSRAIFHRTFLHRNSSILKSSFPQYSFLKNFPLVILWVSLSRNDPRATVYLPDVHSFI